MRQGLREIVTIGVMALASACAGNATTNETQRGEEERQRKAEFTKLIDQVPNETRLSLLKEGFEKGLTDSQEAMDAYLDCGMTRYYTVGSDNNLTPAAKKRAYSTLSRKCEAMGNSWLNEASRYAGLAGESYRERELDARFGELVATRVINDSDRLREFEWTMQTYERSAKLGNSKTATALARKALDIVNTDERIRNGITDLMIFGNAFTPEYGERIYGYMATAARAVGNQQMAVVFSKAQADYGRLNALLNSAGKK